jgi:hypothetical protein
MAWCSAFQQHEVAKSNTAALARCGVVDLDLLLVTGELVTRGDTFAVVLFFVPAFVPRNGCFLITFCAAPQMHFPGQRHTGIVALHW